MGGSVAVHVAASKALQSIAGLVVVDVVEVWIFICRILLFFLCISKTTFKLLFIRH